VNLVIDLDESNIWYSQFCHVNFGCMMWLASLSVLPKFTLVIGSKSECNANIDHMRTQAWQMILTGFFI